MFYNMAKAHDTFCPLPWLHLQIAEGGKIYPCAVAARQAPILDSLGRPSEASDSRQLEAAWNSEYMKELRRTMLNGKISGVCKKCFVEESYTDDSYRKKALKKHASWIVEHRKQLSKDGFAEMRFRTLDLRLGNQCNLKCRMCSPTSSRNLLDEWIELRGLDRNSETVQAWLKPEWFRNPKVWERLLEGNQLSEIHFAGGEPLMIRGMYQILDRLIESGQSKSVALSYNTNLTLFPENIFDLWDHFSSVSITASIDGYGKLNEYIREPTRWAVVADHLALLDEKAKEGRLSVYVNTTVQIYNVFGLPRLFDFLSTFRNIDHQPFLNPLEAPEYFSIQVLPAHLKKRASGNLLEYVNIHLEEIAPEDEVRLRFRSQIEGLIFFMYASDQSAKFSEFKKMTHLMDARRKITFGEVVTELNL